MSRECLAQEIIASCLEMSRLGLNQGTSGNISVRYQGDADYAEWRGLS